jgi:hypothetical protein
MMARVDAPVYFNNTTIVLVLSSMCDHIMYYLRTNDMQHSLGFQLQII